MRGQLLSLLEGTAERLCRALVALIFAFGLLLHAIPEIETEVSGEVILISEKSSLHILPQPETTLRSYDLRLKPKPENPPPAIIVENTRVVLTEGLHPSEKIDAGTSNNCRRYIRPLSQAPPLFA